MHDHSASDLGAILDTRYLKLSGSLAEVSNHSHTVLTEIGTNTHAQIDTFISTTVPTTYVPLTRTITEGAGLAGNTYDLSANRTLAMGTPSTLTVSTTNSASGTTHLHAITSSSNPGSAASLLASNSSGLLQLVGIGLNRAGSTTTPLDIQSTASFATLSATLITNGDFGTGDFTGWSAGAGWSVVANAAVCASGSGTALSQNVSVLNGSWYVLYFDYNRPSGFGNVTITLGTQTYYVNPTNATNRSITMSANTTGTVALSITPASTAGDTTFDNIRLYRVTAVSNPNQRYYNSSGTLTMEFRDGGNVGNAGFGAQDLSYLVPSIDGAQGIDNLAFGTNSLENTTTGDRNISVGTQCMRRLTHGSANTAIGYGAAIFGYGFTDCVAIGNQSMRNQLIGGGNVVIGTQAMFTNQYSGLNVAIGYQALYSMNHAVATANAYNTAVGTWAMQNASTGILNTGIGAFALQAVGTGSSNVAMGYGAGQTVAKSSCVLLGREAGYQIGSSSICIGYQAGYSETGSNRLYIHNSNSTTPLIYGLFSGTGAGVLIRSQATDGVPLIVRGIASQASNLQEWQNSSSQVLVSFDGVGGAIFNEQGAATADFRVESDTEANMVFLDANGGTDGALYLGGSTNGVKIIKGGDLSFLGTSRIEWTKKTAASVTITAGGTDASSVVANLQTENDGNIFHLDEAAATPGIDFYVEFTSITAFNWVLIRGNYSGGSTHAIGILLYDWVAAAWKHKSCIQDMVYDTTAGQEVICNESFFVPSDTNFIGTGGDAGKVRVRFVHPMAGNASHDLYIDVVALYQ